MKKLITGLLSFIIILSPVTVLAEENENTNGNEENNLVLPASPTPSASPEPTTTENTNESKEESTENKEEETKEEEQKESTTTTGTSTEKEEETTKETETKEEEVVECTLKNIEIIKGGKLDKDFDIDTKSYTIIPDEDADENEVFKSNNVKVNTSEGCTVIKSGTNPITITITQKNEKETKYQYTLKLETKVPEVVDGVKSIKMPGFSFNEAFSQDRKEYTVDIDSKIETATIEVIPVDNNSTVTLENASLGKVTKDGEKYTINIKNLSNNIIKVSFLVNEEKYSVTINRVENKELEEVETSIIKETSDINTEENTLTVNDDNNDDEHNVDSPDSILSMFVITFSSIVLFTIGGFGIYFFVKTSPKRMKKEIIKDRKKQEEENSPMVEVQVKETKKKEIENKYEEKVQEEKPKSKIETLEDDDESIINEDTIIFERNKDE